MAKSSGKANWTALAASIVICSMAGAIGSVFTFDAIPVWYASLAKPPFSPPNWIFGPVWTSLYILMGISAYLIWQKGWANKPVRAAITLFGAQLSLNTIWSILFFGMRSPSLGFAGIVLLWISIVLTMRDFHRLDRRAAYLLVPYILWVSFASILNFAIWMLNG